VDAGQVPRSGGHGDLVPLDQLIRGTPGAHPVTSAGELRNGASGTGELRNGASGTGSRYADRA